MINKSIPELSIVVPCYNEEQILADTSVRLMSLLEILVTEKKVSSKSSIIYVDDGSTDKTWEIIECLSNQYDYIGGIKLSCNRGHQNALLAGILNVRGDAVVSIDADLQDDYHVIEDMIDAYSRGVQIVYGVRKRRDSDTAFKRITAESYYKLLKVMGVNIIFNHADFRLLSRRVIDSLEKYQEVNLFLRGLIPTIGYSSEIVSFDRKEREKGESKYPVIKMASLALNGITSYSSLPLRMIAVIGFSIFLITVVLSLWVAWSKLFGDGVIPGWASSVLPMYLLGGIQLLSIGVLGEYVGKIYMETKRRPRYIIEKIL